MTLHRYVLGLAGILVLFAGSYPIACWRVSQSEKFAGSHLKSFTLEWKQDQALHR